MEKHATVVTLIVVSFGAVARFREKDPAYRIAVVVYTAVHLYR